MRKSERASPREYVCMQRYWFTKHPGYRLHILTAVTHISKMLYYTVKKHSPWGMFLCFVWQKTNNNLSKLTAPYFCIVKQKFVLNMFFNSNKLVISMHWVYNGSTAYNAGAPVFWYLKIFKKNIDLPPYCMEYIQQ